MSGIVISLQSNRCAFDLAIENSGRRNHYQPVATSIMSRWAIIALRRYDDTKILTHPHFAVEPLKGKIDGVGAAYRCSVKVQDMQSEARVTGACVRNILPTVHPPMDSRRVW